MNIRLYRDGDLPRLIEITLEAFQGVSIDQNIEQLLGPSSGAWRMRKGKAIELDVSRCPEGVFVAEKDGSIVGYVTTWIDRQHDSGYIPNLGVASGFRGQGLGRQLIERGLAFFRQHDLTFARIETLDQNDVGQHLYPSTGFREVARQIHYAMRLDGENNE
ncbi:MAG: ribosomal protein S18 acetylase RimI-like enzyme [Pirellulaceae bacterium]